jgi:hypothetical protein
MGTEELSRHDATEVIRDIERRLQSLVEADAETSDALHASNFQLVNPSGGVWSKEQYLGGIAAGSIDYRRFEAISDIEVMVDGNLAVLRYRSAIEIKVQHQEAGTLHCWHTDCYRRDQVGAPWQVVWSQATEIEES